MKSHPNMDNNTFRTYNYFGAHIVNGECIFRVWAPNIKEIFVYGDFNGWVKDDPEFRMMPNGNPGEFELTKNNIDYFSSYKYFIMSESEKSEKVDPYSFCSSDAESYSSKIYDNDAYVWNDEPWINSRKRKDVKRSALNIYECHLGSWKRNEDGSFLSYRLLAEKIVPYVKENGYTHIELMPVMEHPFYGSWGYEICSYYAPSSRYGSPDGLKFFIDYCHCHGIGVILDWQPAHFPKDKHGLYRFNGDWCYEYYDESKREQPTWNTCTFDFGKKEVQSFLISNALFWIDKYHIDGLRVDAVSSMIFLDFGRKPGQWHENEYGGRENTEAISFLRLLNNAIAADYPDVFTVAEESNAWQMVTRPSNSGGLGFTFKWNMGWSHDTLEYAETDPFFRKNMQRNIVFPISYAFSENHILPYSHDDVSCGKKSMFEKMFGDNSEKLAGLRLFMGYMISHPGKKLSFMGNEFGQKNEWNHEKELDWDLLDDELHAKILGYVRELNFFYLEHPALWKNDCSNNSFKWISNNDVNQNIIVFMRECDEESLLFVLNFAPVTRYDYRIGVPYNCNYIEIFSSDDSRFGGGGISNGTPDVFPFPQHGFEQQIALTLPPLSVICLKADNNLK